MKIRQHEWELEALELVKRVIVGTDSKEFKALTREWPTMLRTKGLSTNYFWLCKKNKELGAKMEQICEQFLSELRPDLDNGALYEKLPRLTMQQSYLLTLECMGFAVELKKLANELIEESDNGTATT